MIIYKTTNLITGKSYIGQDSKDNPNYFGSGTLLKRSFSKYGKENFRKEIMAWGFTKDHLNFLEKLYIDLFQTKIPNGYNLTDGGEGSLGFTPSEETRKKLSNSQKGKHSMSEEHKNIISKLHKGKVLSEETKQKIKLANMGKVYSEDVKKSMGIKGRVPWNKGKTYSRNKNYEGYIVWNKGLDFSGMTGKHHTEETRKRISESKKGTKYKKGELNQ